MVFFVLLVPWWFKMVLQPSNPVCVALSRAFTPKRNLVAPGGFGSVQRLIGFDDHLFGMSSLCRVTGDAERHGHMQIIMIMQNEELFALLPQGVCKPAG